MENRISVSWENMKVKNWFFCSELDQKGQNETPEKHI